MARTWKDRPYRLVKELPLSLVGATPQDKGLLGRIIRHDFDHGLQRHHNALRQEAQSLLLQKEGEEQV